MVNARGDTSGRPRVVILGGGFGGIGAAKKLSKSDLDVVLVDGHDYHTFQPLLYQLATGLLDQAAVAHPIRDLFHKQENIRVHQDQVTEIDLDAREVRFSELQPERYDYLVIALAREVNFFGVDGAAEHAFPLYTLADAMRLQGSRARAWEAADRNPELVADGALNMVMVGGGPTGVETAGAMAELYTVFAKRLPGQSDPEQAQIVLVEASPRECRDVQTRRSAPTRRRRLKIAEVEVMTGEVVTWFPRRRVTLKNPELSSPPTRSFGEPDCRRTRLGSARSASSSSAATGWPSTRSFGSRSTRRSTPSARRRGHPACERAARRARTARGAGRARRAR